MHQTLSRFLILVVLNLLFSRISLQQRLLPTTNLVLSDEVPLIYIQSPGYPDKNYPSNFARVYNVSYPEGFTLQITLEKFVLQKSDVCNTDFLDITSFKGIDSYKTETICGVSTGRTFEFDGNRVTLTFQTDLFVEDIGFYIRIALTRPLCRCGQPNRYKTKPRIFGGDELKPNHKYPWLVSVANEKGDHICGGSIISDRYILTAAHCFKDDQGQFNSALNTRVVLGAHDLKTDSKRVIQPFDVILHDEYVNTGFNIRNDIALIKLAEPLVFMNTIRPVCLPPKNMLGPYANISVAGWGKTEKGAVSDIPLEVFVPEVNFDTCQKIHGFRIKKGKVVCAGGLKGRDSCVGDSGGPLMLHSNNDQTIHIIGVVSFGDTCGEAGKYGVYTKVASFLDWIADNTQDSWTCPREGAPTSPTKSVCGIAKTTRVNGGDRVPGQEFPWMVAIGYDSTLVGGGTLVAPKYVLTTAWNLRVLQSYNGFNQSKLIVVLGTSDLSKSGPTTRIYAIDQILLSPDGQLALLKLKGDPEEFDRLYPNVCLPKSTEVRISNDYIACGWGRATPGGQSSQYLKKLKMMTLDENYCANSGNNIDKNKLICAGSPFEGLCQGDDGAGLMKNVDNRYYIFGVLLFTTPETCAASKANIFYDIRRAMPWISTHINSL